MNVKNDRSKQNTDDGHLQRVSPLLDVRVELDGALAAGCPPSLGSSSSIGGIDIFSIFSIFSRTNVMVTMMMELSENICSNFDLNVVFRIKTSISRMT